MQFDVLKLEDVFSRVSVAAGDVCMHSLVKPTSIICAIYSKQAVIPFLRQGVKHPNFSQRYRPAGNINLLYDLVVSLHICNIILF